MSRREAVPPVVLITQLHPKPLAVAVAAALGVEQPRKIIVLRKTATNQIRLIEVPV